MYESTITPPGTNEAPGTRLDRFILVYDGDSGLGAMLRDAVKKAVGREDCALCEITYSPLGRRTAFRTCERRLGVIVEELHRDQLPEPWGVSRADLPCVLGRLGTERPFLAVTREEIVACQSRFELLEAKLRAALAAQAAVTPAGR